MELKEGAGCEETVLGSRTVTRVGIYVVLVSVRVVRVTGCDEVEGKTDTTGGSDSSEGGHPGPAPPRRHAVVVGKTVSDKELLVDVG